MNKYVKMNIEDINTKDVLTIFSNDSILKKYSAYELVRTSKESLIIRPAEDSKEIFYKPFELYPTILIDFLDLINDIVYVIDKSTINPYTSPSDIFWPAYFNNEIPLYFELGKRILKFNNLYGSFGTNNKKYNNTTHSEKIGIIRTNLIDDFRSYRDTIKNSGTFFSDEGIYEVFDYEQDIKANDLREKLSSNENLKFVDFLSRYTDKNEDLLSNLFYNVTGDPDRYLGEFLFEIEDKIVTYLPTIYDWIRFKHGNFSLTDDYISLTDKSSIIHKTLLNSSWKKALEDSFTVSNIGISVDFTNSTPKLSWKFNSLFEALQIMLIYDITIGANKIGFCLHCGRPFPQNNNNSKIYCNQSCGSAYRKKRERKNVKEDVISLYISGTPIEILIEKYSTHKLTVKQIEKWVKEANKDG